MDRRNFLKHAGVVGGELAVASERARSAAAPARVRACIPVHLGRPPAAMKARELIQSGMLGKLYGVDMYTIADQTRLKNPEYQRAWYASKSRAGGGHLMWLGIHYLDLIQYISGDRIR